MKCRYCKGSCIKKGKQNGRQRYFCKTCSRYQQRLYTKPLLENKYDKMTCILNNEGMGISSISRILGISKSSVQRILERISSRIQKPIFRESNQNYEIDELRAYIGIKKQECWVTYAINKTSGAVIDLIVGRRTKDNLKEVVNTVLNLSPNRIYTNGLIFTKA